MTCLSSCWRNEWRLFRRSRWLPVALAILPVMAVIYQFIMVMMEHEHPTGWISLSMHVSLVGMLVFLLFGLTMAWQEQRACCDDVMYALPGSALLLTGGKSIALLAVWGLTSGITIVILSPLTWIQGIPLVLYRDYYLFMLMYWFLPWLICGMMGLLVGMLVHSRLAYPLILLLWLLTSPINMGFFRIIMMALGGTVDLRRAAYLFNLSIFDPQQGFDPTYGFPLEAARWASHVLWIAVIGILLFTIASVRSRTCYRRATAITLTVTLILAIPSAVIAARPSQILREYHDPLSAASYDMQYYANHNRHPDSTELTAPVIDACTLRINTQSGQLEATAEMEVSFKENTDAIWFTLYRDLTVTNITIDGKDVDGYSQDGDYLRMPVSGSPGQAVPITIDYAGIISPFMYANDQTVMLPSFFPWYPRAGVHPVMLTHYQTSAAQLMPQPEEEASFTVVYSGPKPVFSNLPQTGQGTFSGSAGGVTLMAGSMTSVTVDGATVVYPAANYPYPEHIPSMLHQLKEQSGSLSSLFPDKQMNVNTLFLINNEWPATSGNWVWAMNDHSILSVSKFDWQGDLLQGNDWRPDIAAAWTRDCIRNGEDLPVYNLYQNALSDYFALRDGGYETSYSNLTLYQEGLTVYDDQGNPLPPEQWPTESQQKYQAAKALQTYLEQNTGHPDRCETLLQNIYHAFCEQSVSTSAVQACIDRASVQKEG